jgi:hypothetical protein
MTDNRQILLDDPWTVDSADFPSDGTTDKFFFLLNYAVLAPSILNTQPWRFRITDTGIELFADRTRLLPVTDHDGRQLTISCGAALLNLRIALRGFGFQYASEVFPDPDAPDLLARLTISGHEQSSEADERLRNAITLRRTNRGELLDQPLPPALMKALSTAATTDGCTLEIAAGQSVKDSVADLIAEAHANLLANANYQHEMGDWVSRRISEARTRSQPGASIAGQTPARPTQSELRVPSAASAARMFSRNPEAVARLSQHLTAAPIIALLTTPNDEPENWMMAGQGLQRALLEAAAAGACASFLNAPIEVSSLRPKLAELFGTRAIPQILLRFGYGAAIPPEPRRPVAAVLVS